MGLSRLRNISKGILQLICNKKHLDEEMVHIYRGVGRCFGRSGR